MNKPDGDTYEFALCLTHDVDRPYKTFQAPFYALKERDISHLRSLVSDGRPYWQFGEIMELEEDLGVRSSFYFLNEKDLFRHKSPGEWLRPRNWKLFAGRYDISDPSIVDTINELDRGGWEIGLHGSFESYNDLGRLRHEKQTLEGFLDHDVIGGRQHYLNLERPTTWEYHREIGLKYDATLGSNESYGFGYGYDPLFPFEDYFAVFPLTIMAEPLMDEAESLEDAWASCRSILRRADRNNAVMTILWHPRLFNEREFPAYKTLYTRIVESALQMGAWVGPCGEYYREFIT